MAHRAAGRIWLAALLIAVTAVSARAEGALSYLEGLKGSDERYKAPSELDPRYTIALYVNAATRGAWRQRMWVLQRDSVGAPWRLAMWDRSYWRVAELGRDGAPPYSWLVSTGRHYPGNPFSGPTPLGVFALDERRGRYGRGLTAAGMVHTMYLDLHYADGRPSGVAFHGTTPERYAHLGTNDSHGCIRMTQANALALLDRITGRDGVLKENMRWGEVPRFWRLERGETRWGYARDGTMFPVKRDTRVPAASANDPIVQVADRPRAAGAVLPDVLTKVGFRAIAVIFSD